jgi:AcrR family transcriptional regulator
MPKRRYNLESRRRQQAERRAGIAAATARLHAAKGVIATSYADIAGQAGVSVPTVYSHFPTQRELLQGCTGHVAAVAPVIPVDRILGAADLSSAAELLVTAMEQQHLHFEPWLAKREDGVIAFLAELSAGMRQERTALVARLLEQYLGRAERREMIAGWESVLSFDLWHRLIRGHRLPRAAAKRVLVQCLLAMAGADPGPVSITRPRRRP